MGIATRLNDSNKSICALTEQYDATRSDSTIIGHTNNITYLGISDLSIEVHFGDGSTMRITNPDFLTGLEIRTYERDT